MLSFLPSHTYLDEKVYVSSALIHHELQQKDNHQTSLFFVSCLHSVDTSWRLTLRVLCEKVQTVTFGGLRVDEILKKLPHSSNC